MRKRLIQFIVVLAVCVAAGLALAGFNTLNYGEQGGARTVIGGSLDVVSGGDLDIESGATLKLAGTAITSTALELNAVDGITSTVAELNILDGVTATAAEINRTDSFSVSSFNICGEATTVNNNTVYYGPSIILLANTSGGQTCDINAAGSVTESVDDEPIYTNQAVQVVGMTCRTEADANAAISYTLRTAEVPTVPSVTCSVADGERDCVADIQTTTEIAAAATVAIAAASTADIADANGFVCQVFLTY